MERTIAIGPGLPQGFGSGGRKGTGDMSGRRAHFMRRRYATGLLAGHRTVRPADGAPHTGKYAGRRVQTFEQFTGPRERSRDEWSVARVTHWNREYPQGQERRFFGSRTALSRHFGHVRHSTGHEIGRANKRLNRHMHRGTVTRGARLANARSPKAFEADSGPSLNALARHQPHSGA